MRRGRWPRAGAWRRIRTRARRTGRRHGGHCVARPDVLAGRQRCRAAHLLDDAPGLAAIDAKTGTLVASFGQNGILPDVRAHVSGRDLQERAHHAGRRRAGKRPDRQGMGRRHRQAGVDVLSEGAARRSESRDLARRQRRVRGDAGHLGHLHAGRGARHALHPGREGRRRLLGRQQSRQQPLQRFARRRSTR